MVLWWEATCKPPVHNAPPPLIEVQGTHGEIGRQVGEARREQIQHSVANARVLIDESYDQLELTSGRLARGKRGDRIAGALGHRHLSPGLRLGVREF